MRRALATAAIGLALSLGACGGQGETASSFVPVREAQFSGALPEPTGDVVLTVRDGDDVVHAFDIATLELMETVEITILDPFLNATHQYTGVRVSELLDALGAKGVDLPAEAALRFEALDDYTVTLTVDELRDALLATRQDGLPIPVDAGGPTRIVFIGDTATARNSDNWIWSLRTMDLP